MTLFFRSIGNGREEEAGEFARFFLPPITPQKIFFVISNEVRNLKNRKFKKFLNDFFKVLKFCGISKHFVLNLCKD